MIIRKLSPIISSITKFSFSSAPTYPYKFGGIPQLKCSPNHLIQSWMKQHFGNNIIEDFKSAYFSVLDGLQHQDEEFLKQLMQKKLIQNINFIDVALINEQRSHQYGLISAYLVIGAKFERTQATRNILLQQTIKNSFKIYLSSGIYQDMPSIGKDISIPFVFGTEFFLGSQAKLIREEEENNKDKRQYHTINFELQHHVRFEEITNIMHTKQNQNDMLEKVFVKPLLDKEWKVADMDGLLNGNISKIGFSSPKGPIL